MTKRPRYYVLDGHEPRPVDVLTWASWIETSDEDRIVAQTDIPAGIVSTVFLGADHNYREHGPPLLFETMTFIDGVAGDVCERCATWDQAVAQHARVVARFARP